MSAVEGYRPSGIVERVKAILLKPVETWTVINGEPATAKGLYTGYACILAAIPPVAELIGGQVFGHSFFGVTWRPPLVGAIAGAIFTYVLSLVAVFVLALVIDALAPSFDGRKNQVQALKVAIYANTAGWVAGIFHLLPALGILAVLGGLYSLYLLYLGLPRVMGAPESKALGYTAVTAIIAVVLFAVVGFVVGVAGLGTMGRMTPHTTASDSNGDMSGTLKLGGASIDLGKLQAAGRQFEAAAKQREANNNSGAGDAGTGAPATAIQAVAADVLKTYLPESIAGYARGDVSTSSGGAVGYNGSQATAEYAKGGAHMTLTVTDLAGAGGFAGLAGAFGVEASHETATGYDKIGKVDGRMTTEEWDRQSKHGKFGVLVADRFMVEAEGNADDIDDLKAAVGSVGPDRLERLARN